MFKKYNIYTRCMAENTLQAVNIDHVDSIPVSDCYEVNRTECQQDRSQCITKRKVFLPELDKTVERRICVTARAFVCVCVRAGVCLYVYACRRACVSACNNKTFLFTITL